jgi:hypothetical protein
MKGRLKKDKTLLIKINKVLLLVGVAGFEPATSSSQTRRDDRATLHPEYIRTAKIKLIFNIAR